MRTQTIGAAALSLTQTYEYDSVSRLTKVSEPGTKPWNEEYRYTDALGRNTGNRWVDPSPAARYGLPALTLETPQAASWYPGDNQINTWPYDDAGNVTGVGSMERSFNYDAENRQVTATIGGIKTTYTYDGQGQRVQKVSGGSVTTYVYDAEGKLAAEYSTVTAPSECGTAICYVTADHLGSTRLLTDTNGNVARRYDYLPFGVELLAGTNGRTAEMGYQSKPDTLGVKFTGQMRDGETGLDYFNARYYSPEQGRFTSPDPGNAGADLANPQTWNGYAYVSNNPLTYTDPSGLGIFGDIGGFIGSFFPGFGTLIGWGIGSIADLATGQSISPPGFNIGGAIFGSIAGSVNNGQPWNEQLPSGVGSIGGLNTGTVFGSGNVGGMVFSFTDAACNVGYAVDFVKTNVGAAAEVAAKLRVPTQNVLGLSAAESRWGLDWNVTRTADNGQPAMNFFSLQGNAKSPFANGSVLSGKGTRLSAFPSYKAAAQSLEAQYGGLVTGKKTPLDFATALVPRFNSGKAPLGNANFIRDLVRTIGMTQRRMGCH